MENGKRKIIDLSPPTFFLLSFFSPGKKPAQVKGRTCRPSLSLCSNVSQERSTAAPSLSAAAAAAAATGLTGECLSSPAKEREERGGEEGAFREREQGEVFF
jgi:hypothetical protein